MQEQIQTYLITYGTKFMMAILILLVGLWVIKRLRSLAIKVMEKRKIDPLITTFLSTVIYVLLFIFVIIAALSNLGLNTTSLIAVLGAAGLAIGLSLQSSLSNLASGVIIITLRPFKVGDYIEAGGDSGIVEGIQLFYTKMRSPDNKEVTVPNSKMTTSSIINYSARSERRCDMIFGVSYDSDLETTRNIIKDLLEKDERVLPDPEPMIVLGELADNSVNFWVRPWVKTDDFWQFKWDFTEAVKKRFDEAGIGIPYPQRDVHVYSHGQNDLLPDKQD